MNTLELHDVSLELDGKTIVSHVDLAFKQGEVLGLIGPNGAGKSSLLRLASGLQRQNSGRVMWNGADVARESATWRARRIAFMPQDRGPPSLMAVRDLVALGRLPHGEIGADAENHVAVRSALRQTGLDVLADRPASHLSGGERARMYLARALAVDAQILLVDEPIAALDPDHALSVMALLRENSRRGCAVVVVLHDLVLAARFCDRLALMEGGRILAGGTPDEVLTDENIRAAYGITVRRLDGVPVPWARCT